jgi:hypothetical protein
MPNRSRISLSLQYVPIYHYKPNRPQCLTHLYRNALRASKRTYSDPKDQFVRLYLVVFRTREIPRHATSQAVGGTPILTLMDPILISPPSAQTRLYNRYASNIIMYAFSMTRPQQFELLSGKELLIFHSV